MTDNEKIECAIHCMKSQAEIEVCGECMAYDMDDSTCKEIATEAFKSLEEVQEYRKIGTVEECKLAMEYLHYLRRRRCRVDGVVEKCMEYEQIGTVEECRKAVEKQKAKKCVIDPYTDYTHYKCPSCGKIHLSRYKHGLPRLGRIPRFCEYCGQAIDENLEVMEDE